MTRFNFLFLRALRHRLERRISVWENDGGKVPNEENVYLVNGRLMKGWTGFIGWQFHRVWKHVTVLFARPAKPHPTF